MSLREALDTFPAVDWPDIIRQLGEIPGSAMRRQLLGEHGDWGAHEENTARLLDIQAYWVDWSWSEKTVDPNDPAVRRERLEAKRKGATAPKRPLIPPVAARPQGIAEQRLTEYLERVTDHMGTASDRRMVSTDEFDRLIDSM